MSEVKLTVAQVAALTGETVHVIRNWLKDFRQYIPLVKSESGYNLFTQDAINVIKDIQRMYRDQKLTTRQIKAILDGADKPTASVQDDARVVSKDIDDLKNMLQYHIDLSREMIARMDDHIKKRDEQLMYVLKELREQKKLLSSQTTTPWWKRVFKA